MRRHWLVKGLKIALFAALFVTVFGFVVMELWNWLLPSLFGWHRISWGQALGVLLLSKILFGGFHGRHGGPRPWRRRMAERWEQMTPEEREKFRTSMQSCWGAPEPPPAAPKA